MPESFHPSRPKEAGEGQIPFGNVLRPSRGYRSFTRVNRQQGIPGTRVRKRRLRGNVFGRGMNVIHIAWGLPSFMD